MSWIRRQIRSRLIGPLDLAAVEDIDDADEREEVRRRQRRIMARLEALDIHVDVYTRRALEEEDPPS